MDMITLAMAKAYADRFVTTTQEVLLPETVAEFEDTSWLYTMSAPLNISEGDSLIVTWDGVEYSCTVAANGETLWFGSDVFSNGANDDGVPFFFDVNDRVTNILAFTAGTHTFSVSKNVEGIDPRYSLSGIVDFDELGLTAAVLGLVNGGGGLVSIGSDDYDKVKLILMAFPTHGDYIAKLTIPGVGTMYVNPVYTQYKNGKFEHAHFDSYLMQNNQLMKFYVRVLLATNASGPVIAIEVGFYT